MRLILNGLDEKKNIKPIDSFDKPKQGAEIKLNSSRSLHLRRF